MQSDDYKLGVDSSLNTKGCNSCGLRHILASFCTLNSHNEALWLLVTSLNLVGIHEHFLSFVVQDKYTNTVTDGCRGL